MGARRSKLSGLKLHRAGRKEDTTFQCQCREKQTSGQIGHQERWMADHWNRLPRDMVVAPSLLEFKDCLDST